MKEVCFECDIALEMLMPTEENPERRFVCLNCGDIYIDIEFSCDEELGLN